MYSPIAQNKRHLKILKEILKKEGLASSTWPLKSLVIMANPKTIINKYNCPASINKSIYKYDQITTYLDKLQNDKNNEKNVLEKYMYDVANFLIERNAPIKIDYNSKYRLDEKDFLNDNNTTTSTNLNDEEDKYRIAVHCDNNKKEKNQLYNQLKEYRLLTSKKENIKPYFIFSNNEMEALISKYPTSEKELLEVKGFGKKKVEKYGRDILDIFCL